MYICKEKRTGKDLRLRRLFDLCEFDLGKVDCIFIIGNVIVLSDLVESSGYSSKTLQKGSCPYAPLDEALR